MPLTPAVLKALEKLEKLEKEFLIEGVSDEQNGVNGHWSHRNRVKLWPIGRKTGELLRLLALAQRPATILELGTSAGYSSLWLASAASEYGGTLHTIEMYRPKLELAKQAFKESGLDGWILQIEGEILKALDSWNTPIEMVFIDSDQKKYYSHLKKLEPHLAHGAIIVADNATNFAEDMRDYSDYVTRDTHYVSRHIDVEDGVLISRYRKDL